MSQLAKRIVAQCGLAQDQDNTIINGSRIPKPYCSSHKYFFMPFIILQLLISVLIPLQIL